MTLINLKFNLEMEKAVMEGRKCCTTRDEPKGKPGDIFIVRDRMYRILDIIKRGHPAELNLYNPEGFSDLEAFRSALVTIYPELGRFSGNPHEFHDLTPVYVHYFAYVRDWCPQFGISGSACSDPENLCPIYEECRKIKEAIKTSITQDQSNAKYLLSAKIQMIEWVLRLDFKSIEERSQKNKECMEARK